MSHSREEEAEREQNKLDAERYRKLRAGMGYNVKSTWNQVCNLGAIASYVSHEEFDLYLDGIDFEVVFRSK